MSKLFDRVEQWLGALYDHAERLIDWEITLKFADVLVIVGVLLLIICGPKRGR